MMIKKRLLIPGRARQIPPHFSWIDHRLIRHVCLRQCESPASALYLAAVATVADAQGLSYCSDASLCRMLHLETGKWSNSPPPIIANNNGDWRK